MWYFTEEELRRSVVGFQTSPDDQPSSASPSMIMMSVYQVLLDSYKEQHQALLLDRMLVKPNCISELKRPYIHDRA